MPRRLVKRVNGKLLAAALVGGVVAWFGIVGYVFFDSQKRISRTEADQHQLCLASNDSRSALRDILMLARDRSEDPADDFWRLSLDRVKPLDCKEEP